MKKINKIFNRYDDAKKFNKNYFFCISLLVLVFWIVCWNYYDQIFNWIIEVGYTDFSSDIPNMSCIFLQSLLANLSIIILLPTCLYFERKYGSLKLLLLLLCAIPISNIIQFGYHSRLSALAFYFFGIMIVDFLFDIKYFKGHKVEVIFPCIVIVIGILFSCIDIDTGAFTLFQRLLYPEHMYAFISGLLITPIIKCFNIKK